MARAALPFANLARPSSTKIVIVTPGKPDGVAAIASSVPFIVQIEGRRAKRVVIETRSTGVRPARIELLSAGADRYEGAITIGQENVRYRIFAGDAVTAWHTLEARPRPRAVEFAKTIVPPAYAGLPETSLTEEQGDISALEGSTVKLSVRTNQAIDRAAATIFPSTSTLPVTVERPDLLRVNLTLDGKSDSWQLALTAKDTGFTNDEASPWRIESVADLPPTVTITQPSEQIEVRSDDAIQVSGEAGDDIGLAKIELAYAINGADWKSSTVAEKSGKEAVVSAPLKLAPLPVKPGDAVLVKLIATDLKGQTAESQPLRLMIVEAKLNLAKREWAAKQRQLAEQAEALAVANPRAAQGRRAREGGGEEFAETHPRRGRGRGRAREAEAGPQDRTGTRGRFVEPAQGSRAPGAGPPRFAGDQSRRTPARRIARRSPARSHRSRRMRNRPTSGSCASPSARPHPRPRSLADALRAFAAEQTAQAVKENLEHLAPQQNRLADKAIEANRDNDARPKWQEQQRAALAAGEKGAGGFARR